MADRVRWAVLILAVVIGIAAAVLRADTRVRILVYPNAAVAGPATIRFTVRVTPTPDDRSLVFIVDGPAFSRLVEEPADSPQHGFVFTLPEGVYAVSAHVIGAGNRVLAATMTTLRIGVPDDPDP